MTNDMSRLSICVYGVMTEESVSMFTTVSGEVIEGLDT